jgi:TPR repeat protein
MNSFLRAATLSIVAAVAGSMVAAQDYYKDKGFAAFQAGDYATALKEWRPQAEQGISSAYINLGILYAEGKGVLKDPITAHMWYNIGSANASNGMAGTLAPVYRDNIERIMTPEQIADATKRAKVCMASNYQDCD